MSGLYNALFGNNPNTQLLLSMLKTPPSAFGRYRDVSLVDEEGTLYIDVFTRCGGGNREDYQSVFDEMETHPEYVKNWDDDFDSTYATIRFNIPEQFREAIKNMPVDNKTPMEKFADLIEDLKDNKETPQTARALEVGEEIFTGKSPDVGIITIAPKPGSQS